MRPEVATLFGVFLGYATWGLYICLFSATMWIARTQGTTKMGSPVIVAIIVVFVMNFVYTITTTAMTYDTFLGNGAMTRVPYNTLVTLSDIATFSSLLISDSALSWRIYVIWLRDWRILIFPVAILGGLFISGSGLVVMDIIMIVEGSQDNLDLLYQGFANAMVFISLGYNWIATGLIIGRLWWAHRQLRAHASEGSSNSGPSDHYIRIIIALIESGSLYSIVMLAYVIANYSGDGNGQYLFSYTLPRVVGIVPTLIVLQRCMGYMQPNESPNTSAAPHGTDMKFAARTALTTTTNVISRLFSTTIDEREEVDAKRPDWVDGSSGDLTVKIASGDEKV